MTPEEFAEIKARHPSVGHTCPQCDEYCCCGAWHAPEKCEYAPCDAARLVDEVERLRGRVGELEQFIEASANRVISVGDSVSGYPCPKDGITLMLLKGGAWCPECHTVWQEGLEVDLGAALEGKG